MLQLQRNCFVCFITIKPLNYSQALLTLHFSKFSKLNQKSKKFSNSNQNDLIAVCRKDSQLIYVQRDAGTDG